MGQKEKPSAQKVSYSHTYLGDVYLHEQEIWLCHPGNTLGTNLQ